ncbi:MAG: AEC family transporter [Planctomycetota bacterium]
MPQIIDSLLPLALLVTLGYALFRLRFFAESFRRGLDRLVYWVCLPALIVDVLSRAPGAGVVGQAGRMTLALLAATAAMAGVAWGIAKLARLPPPATGVFTQAAFRGNLAFVGLPVIALATGHQAELLAKAALVFAPTVVLYNVLAVAVLTAAHHRFDLALPWRMGKSLFTNPVLIACVVGLAVWRTGGPLPGAIRTSLNLLGQPAGPLALVGLGGALAVYPVGRHLPTATAAALLKCVGTPVLAGLAAAWLGVGGDDRTVLLILAGCPTAVASYVLATQLDGDTALAAATIALSTLLSGVTLGAILVLGV